MRRRARSNAGGEISVREALRSRLISAAQILDFGIGPNVDRWANFSEYLAAYRALRTDARVLLHRARTDRAIFAEVLHRAARRFARLGVEALGADIHDRRHR